MSLLPCGKINRGALREVSSFQDSLERCPHFKGALREVSSFQDSLERVYIHTQAVCGPQFSPSQSTHRVSNSLNDIFKEAVTLREGGAAVLDQVERLEVSKGAQQLFDLREEHTLTEELV